MRLIIRNFIRIFQRFKLAMTLNILGLSVAFTAFMIIMMQWRYDTTFDKDTPHADCIYRVDAKNLFGMRQVATSSLPMANVFVQSSPHIMAGGMLIQYPGTTYLKVEGANGNVQSFKEPVMTCTPGITGVFQFDMLEGSADALQVPDQILIPESLAKKMFGDESALGKRFDTDLTLFKADGIYYVGGVFRDFPQNSILSNLPYISMDDYAKDEWGTQTASLYVRLDSPEAAAGLLDNFARYAKQIGLEETMKNSRNSVDLYEMELEPLLGLHFVNDIMYDFTPKANRMTVYLLFSIAWVILIIAAINFTNFNTALSPIRMKNINTQRVLGSTVGELRRNLTIETVLVSFCAYVLSVYWLYLAERLGINSLVQGEIPIIHNYPIVLLTGLVSILLGAVAGVYPAYYMTSFQPALVLKGSFGLSQNGRRLRTVLMSAQFITAFALIIASIFMSLQNRFMQHTSLGYAKENILIADLSPKAQEANKAVRADLEKIAGVEGVAFAHDVLASGDNYNAWGREHNGKPIEFNVLHVDPSFLKLMDIPVLEGRDFLPGDSAGYGSFIMNKAMAEKYELPVGTKISNTWPIVGVIPNIRFASLRSNVEPMVFFVSDWENPYAYIKTAPGVDMFTVREAVEKALAQFDSSYPSNVRFFDTMLETTYQTERNLTTLITLFSLLAVFISVVGVFGMVVFDSEYKRKEIGIRKVLGSTTAEILVLFNKGYVKVLVVCFLLAAPCAWYGVHVWLQNFAYKIPIYWWVFPVAFLLISLITVATVTYQNWHAANENPVNSIKNE